MLQYFCAYDIRCYNGCYCDVYNITVLFAFTAFSVATRNTAIFPAAEIDAKMSKKKKMEIRSNFVKCPRTGNLLRCSETKKSARPEIHGAPSSWKRNRTRRPGESFRAQRKKDRPIVIYPQDAGDHAGMSYVPVPPSFSRRDRAEK